MFHHILKLPKFRGKFQRIFVVLSTLSWVFGKMKQCHICLIYHIYMTQFLDWVEEDNIFVRSLRILLLASRLIRFPDFTISNSFPVQFRQNNVFFVCNWKGNGQAVNIHLIVHFWLNSGIEMLMFLMEPATSIPI